MIVEAEGDTQDKCFDFIGKASLKTRNADSARIREFHCDCRDIAEHVGPLNKVNDLLEGDLSDGRNCLFSDTYNPFVSIQIPKYGNSVFLSSNNNECGDCKKEAQVIDSSAKQPQGQAIPAGAPVQGESNAGRDIISEVVRILEKQVDLGLQRERKLERDIGVLRAEILEERKGKERVIGEQRGDIEALRAEIAEEKERKRKKKTRKRIETGRGWLLFGFGVGTFIATILRFF